MVASIGASSVRFDSSWNQITLGVMMSNQYLHDMIGGYSNNIRREVRKLFAGVVTGSTVVPVEPICEDNIEIAVGILFEFHQIGIKKFTIQQATRVVELFNLKPRFGERDVAAELDGLFNGPKIRLYSAIENSNRIYDVPDDNRLQHLARQFCKVKSTVE